MAKRIYDLSMPFTRDMPTYFFWKNWHHPPFFATFTDLEETSLGPGTGEGFVSLVAFLTHTGTHMDAPRHFRRGAWYLHEIPPDRFLGEGPVLPVPKGPNEDITVQDLEATEMEVRAAIWWSSTRDGTGSTRRLGRTGRARTITSRSILDCVPSRPSGCWSGACTRFSSTPRPSMPPRTRSSATIPGRATPSCLPATFLSWSTWAGRSTRSPGGAAPSVVRQ